MANKALFILASSVALFGLSGCISNGGPLSNLGWSGGKERPVIAAIKPGPYQPSSEAVGLDKDVDANRVQGMGLVPAPELESYLNGRLKAIRTTLGITDMPGSVHISANPGLKANTSPDGNVFLSLGWIQTLENEDQVMALLSHEICHAAFNHHDANIAGKIGRRIHDTALVGSMLMNMADQQRGGASNSPVPNDLKKIQLLIMVTEQVIVPAWGRKQESECDRFAVDLAVKMNYSLDLGISAVLDKLQAWEAVDSSEKKAEQMRQLAKIENPEAAVQASLQQVIAGLSSDHPDTESRIKDIAAYREAFYPEALPVKANKEAWQRVVGKSPTKGILANYKAAFDIEELLSQQRVKEAVAKGKEASSGPTSDHALPLYRYSLALYASGQQRRAQELLDKSIKVKEPALPPYMLYVQRLEATGQRDKALMVFEAAYKRFNQPPNLMPQFISLYRKSGKNDELNKMLMACRFQYPEYGDQCSRAANGNI